VADLTLRELWPSDWKQVKRLFLSQNMPAPSFKAVHDATKLTGFVGRVVKLGSDDAVVAALVARVDPPTIRVTHLAALPEWSKKSLPALIGHLAKGFPDFDIELRVKNGPHVYEQLVYLRDALKPSKLIGLPDDNGKAADDDAAYWSYRIAYEGRRPRDPSQVGQGPLGGSR
jgi:hypothetical protein